MKVGLLGLGAIGGFLARELDGIAAVETVFGYDPVPERVDALRSLAKFTAASAEEVIAKADVVVEAASQKAVREYAETVVSRGKPFVVLSVGALADEAFIQTLLDACEKSGAKLLVPAGAIGGLDALTAANLAGLEAVDLETRKPPRTLGVEVQEETVLFDGDAVEAVRRFPATVNVAAALSLAGLGAKRTRVRVVADPEATGNTHVVRAHGAFGRMELRFDNVPHPDNPKTSMLAAVSALAVLLHRQSPIRIGP